MMYLGLLVVEIENSTLQHFDPTEHITDGTKTEDIHRGKQKRRKMDEGVEESTHQAVASGRAHNSTSLIKALGDDPKPTDHTLLRFWMV